MSAPETRFEAFNHYQTAYKTIDGHGIKVNILVPKTTKSGTKYPIFVKWHGGGLVHGEAVHAPWFAKWLIPLALRNNAIIVLPNYRLIPEHSGKDVMDDLKDFWKWFDDELGGFVSREASEKVDLDKEKLLVGGDSAGGLLALQSALVTEIGKENRIRALLCQYPMTDRLTRQLEGTFKGVPAPKEDIIDQHMANIPPGTVISSAVPSPSGPPGSRTLLSYALAAYGRWLEFYGKDKELLPITAIEDAKRLPPTLIIHGHGDDVVSIEDSRTFVKKVEDVMGEDMQRQIRLEAIPAVGHGFDMEFSEEEHPWLRDAVQWLERKWLS